MRYVDLSHTITSGMVTYRGLPAPLICDFLSREKAAEQYIDGETFQIGHLTMVGNTGTYIDCPFHRYEDGRQFTSLFLKDLVDLPGILVHVPYQTQLAVDVEHIEHLDVTGKAFLIRTDWATHWGTDAYFENHPFLTESAAQLLVSKQPKLVGIDAYNIDDTRVMRRPVHTHLLGAEIPIVEHLCQLHLLPKDGFYFSAAPPKISGMGSFPVRAYGKF